MPIAHHRAGDRDPLPLSAGELIGKSTLGQPELLECCHRRDASLPRTDAVQLERQRDVLGRGQPGEQVEVLEDVADRPAPQRGSLAA